MGTLLVLCNKDERIAAVLKVDIAFDVFNILSPGEVLGVISMRCLHILVFWLRGYSRPLSTCEIPILQVKHGLLP